MGDAVFVRSITASTEQESAPLRIRLRSARSPSTRLSAPIMIDFPAPVSPVTALNPGRNSSVRSETSARFLMRNVTSMAAFDGAKSAGLAFDEQKEF